MKVSRRDNLDRYYLLQVFGFGLFLHRMHHDEDADVFHSHPWDGVSLIFGSYSEERYGESPRTRMTDADRAHNYEQRLCLHLTQRSCDIALGVPYNIASYALLMHLLSRFSGIPVGTFSHMLVDAHAYTAKADGSMAEFDHVPGLREQLMRVPRRLPTLRISDNIEVLEDVEKLINLDTAAVMDHFVLEGYEPHPAISFKVAV